NSGGAASVSTYMQRLNQSFGTSHYLLDANGIDVVSGHRLEGVLPLAPLSKSRGDVEGQFVVTHRSADGRYWFVSFGPRQPGRWIFFPYYLLFAGCPRQWNGLEKEITRLAQIRSGKTRLVVWPDRSIGWRAILRDF